MRLGVTANKLGAAFLLILILFPIAYSSQFYYFELSDTGWNTGIRQSTTLNMDISGLSYGQGNYSRYGEIGINDVQVRDRTSTTDPKGNLYYQEGIHTVSDDSEDVSFNLMKPAGAQDWFLTINETWPVHIDASRTLDYTGKGINDREYFGNNYENAGSSILYAKDLRKDTTVNLDLKDVHFYAVQNDTTKKMVADEFMPNLTMLYDHRSSFTGIGTFRTQHSLNRKPVVQDEESYWGTFTITRHINSTSSNRTYPWLGTSDSNYYDWYDWLSGCGCIGPFNLPVYSIPISIEVKKND